MKFSWRRRAKGQSVSGSVVFGSSFQIAEFTGDLNATNERQHYRIEDFPITAAAVSADRARAQPSRLLHSRYQVVPFIGRHDELAELRDWMGRAEQIGVRLIHASGGQGKTRLMAHCAAQSAAAGWAVWRVNYSPDLDLPQDPIQMGGNRGVLVLVDYADRWLLSHLRQLVAKLRVIALEYGVTMRVLMVARSAAHWWPALAHDLEGDFGIDAEATELMPLGAQLDRTTLFGAAAAAFAAAMSATYDSASGPPPEIELTEPGFASVLSLHLAALVAVDSQLRGADMPSDPAALSGYLLRREYTHWTRLSENSLVACTPGTMRRVVWLATLIGAVTPYRAGDILRHVGLATEQVQMQQLMDDHGRCYPPEDPRTVFEGLHPDRLGEDFIALSIPGRSAGTAPTMLAADSWTSTAVSRLLADEGQLSHVAWWTPQVVRNLVETARRWQHVATEVLFPLIRQHPHALVAAGDATVARCVKLDGIDAAALTALESCYPQHCRESDIASTVALISTKAYGERLAAATDSAQRARVHRIHAQRLNDARSYGAARTAALEAAGIIGTADGPELAATFTQLAIAEFRLGRAEEAVEHAGKAMSLYPGLSSRERSEHVDDIAALSADYGDWLAAQGHDDKALSLSETVVDVGRTLARENPNDPAPLPALAAALDRIGRQLSLMGRDEEALAATEEAIAWRRQLVDREPYDHLGDLAESLRQRNTQLLGLGRGEEGMASLREAVLILEDLAQRKPAVYLLDWVTALRRMVVQLMDSGRNPRALEFAEQAVRGLRRLSEQDQEQYRSDLAAMLAVLGDLLDEQNRRDDALAAAEEALRLRRLLSEDHPGALATSLRAVSTRLVFVGRAEKALPLATEAEAIYRRLAATDSRYVRPHTESLDFCDTLLESLGRAEETLPMHRETVTLYRQLVAQDAAYLSNLAQALVRVAQRAPDSGYDSQEVDSAAEAVTVYRRLADGRDSTHLPDLAAALNLYGANLRGAKRFADAVAPTQEAIALYRHLTTDRPDIYLPDVADALYWLGLDFAKLDDLDEALPAALESLEHYRFLTRARPDTFDAGLASSAESAGELLARAGRLAEAIELDKESIAAYRRLAEHDSQYLASLAAMLHKTASLELAIGRVGPYAYPALEEAIELYEYLNAQSSGSFGPELARTRNTLRPLADYFERYRAWVKEQAKIERRERERQERERLERERFDSL
ncbi:tetratricopeptide repeat protein [Nocardia pseudovaccinii]|uniref:tetratricopeptide repeat protein n=1 Tax=Nocardia pseudovaccinii TaxID=189540 RepID=UPI0007A38F7C|nr:tetratricopeptide repeat protein [Nocardia pseudovaccinii]